MSIVRAGTPEGNQIDKVYLDGVEQKWVVALSVEEGWVERIDNMNEANLVIGEPPVTRYIGKVSYTIRP